MTRAHKDEECKYVWLCDGGNVVDSVDAEFGKICISSGRFKVAAYPHEGILLNFPADFSCRSHFGRFDLVLCNVLQAFVA